MEIKAQAKFIRVSPRKVKLVIDLIRGKAVAEAETILNFCRKAAREQVLKLLKSARANAVNNFKLDKDNLYIKKIIVGQGPALKRWRPRAFGRAAPIRKHTCHISIVLGEGVSDKKMKTNKQIANNQATNKQATNYK